MLGNYLITKQTGPNGQKVAKVIVMIVIIIVVTV